MSPPMYTWLHPCSCSTYDGSQCTTVFGQANISLGSADFVFLLDREIYQTINFLSITYDQSCLNHNRLIWCMVAYFPWPGSAWCGSNSKDELKIAVASACMCNNPDSCNINGFNISSLIEFDISLHNYYQGSSTTGAVGSNYTMCQDVTSGKRCISVLPYSQSISQWLSIMVKGKWRELTENSKNIKILGQQQCGH